RLDWEPTVPLRDGLRQTIAYFYQLLPSAAKGTARPAVASAAEGMRGSSNGRGVKLIFVNKYFHPDHSATSQMLSDLAFALAERGQAVCVITSRQRYDAPTERLPAREMVKGVWVHRLWTSRFGRANLMGRAVDYATFYATAAWRLWRLARRGD